MPPESTDALTEERSSDQRTTRWCSSYVEALLGANPSRCARLVAEAANLPPAFARVVGTRIAPATAALKDGDAAHAAEQLTAGAGELQPALAAALGTGPAALAGQDDLRTALTQGLTGVWLEAAGSSESAAAAYYESGRHFGWLGEAHAQRSFDLLTRANTLDPTHVDTYWLLANAWFVRSFSDPSVLPFSLEAWNRGAALRFPDATSSWAYVVRALIGEEIARTDDQRRFLSWWQGVVFLERAILLNDRDAARWANLGRLHRMLENEPTCLQATGQGLQRDPEDTTVLDERAAALANAGASDEALKIIEKRLEKHPANVWAKGVKAYILMHQNAYQAALELIDEVIAAEPGNIWNIDVRGTCCRMLDDSEGARAAYTTILETHNTGAQLSSEDVRTRAFAAYNLGRADLALSILEQGAPDPLGIDDRMRLLGLCHLVTGQVTRAEELLLGGIARANIRELDEFLTMDLPGAEKTLVTSKPVRGAIATVRRVRRVGEALLAELRRIGLGEVAREAEAELTLLLEWTDESDLGRWVEAGARAGIARLQLEQGRWGEAAAHYRALRDSPVFPEAGLGFERAAEGLRTLAREHVKNSRFEEADAVWTELVTILGGVKEAGQLSAAHRERGDTLWRAGNPTGAVAAFEEGLAALDEARDPADAASLHARLALGRYERGDFGGMRASLSEALRLFGEAGRADPGGALGDACRPLLRDIDHFWQVETRWTELEEDPSTDAGTRRELASARGSLLAYLEDVCRLRTEPDASSRIPVVTPIVMEVGYGLVPLVDPKSDGGKFLFEDIPAMRQRIESGTGLQRIPGIRVREDGVTRDGYLLLLDGAPCVRGSVRVGLRYCPLSLDALAGLGVATAEFEEVSDPVTGGPGAWGAESSWETLAAHGLTALTETQFILRHVEAVLQQRLDFFIGIQEAEDVIAKFTSDAQVPEPVRAVLGDARPRLLFARVLRGLAREGVPLTDSKAIAEGVQAAAWTTVPAVIRETRLRLKPQLPGNEEGTILLRTPDGWPSLESASADRGPSRADISPEAAHRMLVAVREWLLPYAGPVAFVTADAASRSIVRTLIEFEFPSVAVLSQDEVLQPERVVPIPQAVEPTAQGSPRT